MYTAVLVGPAHAHSRTRGMLHVSNSTFWEPYGCMSRNSLVASTVERPTEGQDLQQKPIVECVGSLLCFSFIVGCLYTYVTRLYDA